MKKSKGLSLRENADSTKRESAPPATDGRFTAWGASSKVIVPRAVGGIRAGLEWAKVGGLAVTDAELAHAIYNCRGALQ